MTSHALSSCNAPMQQQQQQQQQQQHSLTMSGGLQEPSLLHITAAGCKALSTGAIRTLPQRLKVRSNSLHDRLIL